MIDLCTRSFASRRNDASLKCNANAAVKKRTRPNLAEMDDPDDRNDDPAVLDAKAALADIEEAIKDYNREAMIYAELIDEEASHRAMRRTRILQHWTCGTLLGGSILLSSRERVS